MSARARWLLLSCLGWLGGGCVDAGRSLVPVDVTADAGLSLATVSVVVSGAEAQGPWTIERGWNGSSLHLGIYLPRDVTGQATVVACGYDASSRPIAAGAGTPSSVVVTPGQVADTVTVNLTAAAAGSVACGSLAPDGGSNGLLQVSAADYVPTVDLTSEGTIDWTEWGADNMSTFNHKMVSGRPISNVTPQGSGRYIGDHGSPIYFTWSDGAPTANGGTANGLYTSDASFTVTVAATATQRTFRFYVGADGGDMRLVAHLSDGSAPDAQLDVPSAPVDSPMDVLFRAATDQATLTVSWVITSSPATSIVKAATLF
jgi:hypothetical protein